MVLDLYVLWPILVISHFIASTICCDNQTVLTDDTVLTCKVHYEDDSIDFHVNRRRKVLYSMYKQSMAVILRGWIMKEAYHLENTMKNFCSRVAGAALG